MGGELASKQAVLRAVEAALALSEGKKELDMADIFEGFESFEHPPYEEEARERWGHTESYRESTRRAKSYTKADWEQIKREGDAVLTRFAALASGESADSDAAREAAEQHRLHIDRWFYPCSHAQHVALSELYLADARFTAFFEQRAPGLAAFVAASIRANSARQSP